MPFKIRRKSTGLFSSPYGWNRNGKVWDTKGALSNHLTAHPHKYTDDDEVIEVTAFVDFNKARLADQVKRSAPENRRTKRAIKNMLNEKKG
jgi:hypothetical protein